MNESSSFVEAASAAKDPRRGHEESDGYQQDGKSSHPAPSF